MMTSPIVGDEAPNGSTLRANGAHDVAGSEQTLAAPISALEQEGGDARADNKLSDQAADAKVAQNGSLKSYSATAGAAEPNHAGSPSGDPSRGLADAIAADQHPSTLEATSEGPTTREGSPSYPVAIQPAQQLGLQIPPTSSALPLHTNGANASGSRPESNITPDTEVCSRFSAALRCTSFGRVLCSSMACRSYAVLLLWPGSTLLYHITCTRTLALLI